MLSSFPFFFWHETHKTQKKKIASFIPIQPNSTSTQPLLSKLIFFFKKRFEEYYEKEEEESNKEFVWYDDDDNVLHFKLK